MADMLEGRVLDVVDGEVLELEVEHVEALDPGRYGARELIRVADGDASDEESAALMALTYQNRRVRCFVEERDRRGRLVGEIEVLNASHPEALYGDFGDTDDARDNDH